jgi:hypothetical protein
MRCWWQGSSRFEARIVEAGPQQIHSLGCLGAGQSPPLDELLEAPVGVAHARGQRRDSHILEVDRDLRLLGDQLRDTTAHDTGSQDCSPAHRTNGRLDVSDLVLAVLHDPEDVQEILADRRNGELGGGSDFSPLPLLEAPTQTDLDHLDGSQRCGIVPSGALHQPLAGLTQDDVAADRVAFEECRSQAPVPSPRSSAFDDPLGEVAHFMQEGGVGKQGVGQSDGVSLATVDRLAGQDDVQGRSQSDASRQTAAAPPGRHDTDSNLG